MEKVSTFAVLCIMFIFQEHTGYTAKIEAARESKSS